MDEWLAIASKVFIEDNGGELLLQRLWDWVELATISRLHLSCSVCKKLVMTLWFIVAQDNL